MTTSVEMTRSSILLIILRKKGKEDLDEERGTFCWFNVSTLEYIIPEGIYR